MTELPVGYVKVDDLKLSNQFIPSLISRYIGYRRAISDHLKEIKSVSEFDDNIGAEFLLPDSYGPQICSFAEGYYLQY